MVKVIFERVKKRGIVNYGETFCDGSSSRIKQIPNTECDLTFETLPSLVLDTTSDGRKVTTLVTYRLSSVNFI